ncbi:hypothetical protein Hanom_Chr06g00544641 [Helianthus anomalus]
MKPRFLSSSLDEFSLAVILSNTFHACPKSGFLIPFVKSNINNVGVKEDKIIVDISGDDGDRGEEGEPEVVIYLDAEVVGKQEGAWVMLRSGLM